MDPHLGLGLDLDPRLGLDPGPAPRAGRTVGWLWQDPVVMASAQAAAILGWYAAHARDLPWRRPDASPWAVLVSEIMLQQTPVARVLPAYEAWLARWPVPASLAAAAPADAVRQWGRLGYPRRAIRLHASARVIVERHGGEVPSSVAALRELPGVGSYTAAAVASFAFGQRHAVLDTNVRRVLARLTGGVPRPASSPTVMEVRLAESLLPTEPALAPRWSVAVMELGALVCTADRPNCAACPVVTDCAWHATERAAQGTSGTGRTGQSAPKKSRTGQGAPEAGRTGQGMPKRGRTGQSAPEAGRTGQGASGTGRRSQPYEGTDRQCRGRLLAVLRDADGPVAAAQLTAAWPDAPQRDRALASLVADGLAEPLPGGRYALPH